MLLAAPILIAMTTAVLCFIFRSHRWHRWLSLAGTVALLASALAIFFAVEAGGPVAVQMGGWDAPFGITLAADLLSAAMVTIVGISGVACIWYALAEIDEATERTGYHALAHAMMGGVSGAFLTGDLFNLYVWFEVMLISSFGLLVIGGRPRQIDGAVKYVTLNLVGTIAFLTGVGLLYGTTGTVNMADLAGAVEGREGETAVLGSAALLLFAFAAKAAIFPVFFWLPAAYHTPAIATSALFSALLTKVGVYSMIRVFTLIFDAGTPGVQGVLLTGAAITVLLGAMGAAAQHEIRRIYGFHIVSQIGMMLIGLALYTPLALAGAIFYFFHHIPAKMNMFLLGGVIARDAGGAERLEDVGGGWSASPWLAVVFLVPTLSLIGIPPFSGFWAKLLIISASVEAGDYALVAIALFGSALTFFYMGRLFVEAFWKPRPGGEDEAVPPRPAHMLAPILGLTVVTLAISLAAPVFIELAEAAANQLLDPQPYVDAVLGGRS